MTLHKRIKANSILALRSEWGRAGTISLLWLAIWFLFVILESVLSMLTETDSIVINFFTIAAVSLLSLIFVSPFDIGMCRWYSRLADGAGTETSSVFEFFRSLRLFFRAIALKVLVGLRCLLIGAMFLSPGICAYLITNQFSEIVFGSVQSSVAKTASLFAILTAIAGAVFWIIWCMRYLFASFALAEDQSLSAKQAIALSINATRGRRFELFKFELSMLGWRLLELLIVPRLFTMPYRLTARAIYAHYLIEVSKRSQNTQEPV